MDTDRASLDGLPIEILRHIASASNCEAVLALQKVNKALRAACNDRLVYKSLIINGNGHGSPGWPHHLPLSMQSPVSSWARYALADSLATRDNFSSLELTSIASWAPQLLVYHHPGAHSVDMSRLVYSLASPQTRAIEETHALSFCLLLRIMSRATAVDPSSPTPPSVWTGLASTSWVVRELTRYVEYPLQSFADASRCFLACSPAMLMRKRVEALKAVGCFAMMLRETPKRGMIQHPYGTSVQTGTMAIPIMTDIPFHLLMDVPLPFTPSATEELASCHLAKMTTVDFLEEGEWTGFYSVPIIGFHSWSDTTPRFDPPMQGVRFVATADQNDQRVTYLQAVGNDAVGTFDLKGRLAPRTGEILLTKTYTGGSPVWDWVCMMTPVGIVGSWGRADYGGWIWLWKPAWTANRQL